MDIVKLEDKFCNLCDFEQKYLSQIQDKEELKKRFIETFEKAVKQLTHKEQLSYEEIWILSKGFDKWLNYFCFRAGVEPNHL